MRFLIGIGNYAEFDDSIGLRVAEHIAEEGLESGFEVIDLGGNLIDLVHYLDSSVEAVLIVDAAQMDLEPGEFAFFAPEDVATRKDLAGFSTHEGDLLKMLGFADMLDKLPPVTILGIEPAEIREGMGLSAVLQARFGEYVEAAVEFITPGASTPGTGDSGASGD